MLPEVADSLQLSDLFPADLRDLSRSDFESAYSRLFDTGAAPLDEINVKIAGYFAQLQLSEEANLYDLILLCLREKDAIFTFNWDPFLVQSRHRLARLGVTRFPRLFFLHGNVAVGFCTKDRISGLPERRCSKCGKYFEQSKLLFPVEKKNYQEGGLVAREWEAVRAYLKGCFMFTIFGYSAPKTDVEAIKLLKQGWGDPAARQLERTEIITRPDFNEDAIRKRWSSFIHTHHYEVHGSFYDSWTAKHPRRSGEAYRNQDLEAKFIDDNPIPNDITDLEKLVEFFKPLLNIEG